MIEEMNQDRLIGINPWQITLYTAFGDQLKDVEHLYGISETTS